MARGPLFQDGYKPQFSGHETFPLRYGWLKKVFDRVTETEGEAGNRPLCWGDDAIARFGVGKNMVGSMRHWAVATRVILEDSKSDSVMTSPTGRLVFGRKGLDPYMEHPATLWLTHWLLAANSEKTTWYWAFSHYPAVAFDRDHLINHLLRLSRERGWVRAAGTTIRNDVACFIRTYVARPPSGKTGHEDGLESPLTELGLIKAVGKKDGFRFVRGPKSTLRDGVFTYALVSFWSQFSPNASTLSFEAIAHAPGGPGRVFLLEEDDLVDRLIGVEDFTKGALRWSETAGLKQVVRTRNFDDALKHSMIHADYAIATRGQAA